MPFHWPIASRRSVELLHRRLAALEGSQTRLKAEADALIALLHRELARARMAEARKLRHVIKSEENGTAPDALDVALARRKGY